MIDCSDPRALVTFWASITGYEIVHASDTWASIVGEGDRAIRIAFQRVPESKASKNRLHIDLAAPDEEAEATQMEALGAVRRWTSEKADDPFVVLADPEGNEFCVVRLRD